MVVDTLIKMGILGIDAGVDHKGENVHLKLRREVLGEWTSELFLLGINKFLSWV